MSILRDAYHHQHTQSKDWNALAALKTKLEQLGWFKPPPKKSMLRGEPACAWFTAGSNRVNQQSQHLPTLEKTVLRHAVKRFIELHFYIPVAGIMPARVVLQKAKEIASVILRVGAKTFFSGHALS